MYFSCIVGADVDVLRNTSHYLPSASSKPRARVGTEVPYQRAGKPGPRETTTRSQGVPLSTEVERVFGTSWECCVCLERGKEHC